LPAQARWPTPAVADGGAGLAIVPANADLVGVERSCWPTPAALTGCATPHRRWPRRNAPRGGSYLCPDRLPAVAESADLQRAGRRHAVLVPVQCEFFALEGISQLLSTIEQIRATLNPKLEIQGVVLTMHDARTGLSREVADNVRAFFGEKVYETIIPRNMRVAEAPSHGKPILLYDYRAPAARPTSARLARSSSASAATWRRESS
jgi:chromosome partitioning protein